MKSKACPRNLRRIGVISLVACLLSACQLMKLREDLRTIDNLHLINATVQAPAQTKGPIQVMVFEPEGKLLRLKVLPTTGTAEYYLPPGRYELVAFQDVNRDNIYSAGEPADHTFVEIQTGKSAARARTFDLALNSLPLPAMFAVDLRHPENIASLEAQFFNRGTVTALSNQVFDPANGTLGYWQPVTFLQGVEGGIYFLGTYDPKKVPVLFIHGATGTPRDFAGLMQELDLSRVQPWFIYYPTGLPLKPIGRYLVFAMNDLHAQYHFKDMIIVAHSMGGLVAGSFIIENLRQKKPVPIRAFVSISTPWGGVLGAKRGVDRSPAVIPSWKDISPGSDFMNSLLKEPLGTKLPHYLFFSYGKPSGVDSIFSEGNNDGAIDLQSQLNDTVASEAKQIYGFNEDHRSVLKSRMVAQKINRLCGGT